ncbi:C-type lectin domain family 2 member B-like isoform X2 [Cuculus canorus]|uniref:C-type lectin domain family 2 member B-like isoform X2 n=1 Tax=Cuculus canorus TaxID=55661 RepID=UPI0023AA330F|nr:C-type lectin domain family 2 member B-like isoform X2 [Cuculus canorus]
MRCQFNNVNVSFTNRIAKTADAKNKIQTHLAKMESTDEETPRPILMAQGLLGNVDSKQDAEQKVAVRSWVRKTMSFCKQWFCPSPACWLHSLVAFVLGIVLMVIIWALVGQQTDTSHHEKFPHDQCPSEWIYYRRKCYFISEEEKDWTFSQIFCTKNNALLVVFENLEEMHSLAKYLRIDDSWIGLHKIGGSFFWENGIALDVDLFQIRNHSDCAYLDASTVSTSACSLPRRWICSFHKGVA